MSTAPIPPTIDLDAEESVILAVLADPLNIAEISRILTAEDFKTPVYREIFAAAVSLEQRGLVADAITIGVALEQAGFIPERLTQGWVNDLFDKVHSSASFNFLEHAEVVHDRALKRRVHHAANLMAEAANSANKTGLDSVAVAESLIMALGESKSGIAAPKVVSLTDGIQEFMQKLSNPPEDEDTMWGLPTGFNELDANIGGLKPGQVAIIAARPGIGKTTLALQMLINMAAADPSGRTVFFSHELTQEELITRMLCIVLNTAQRPLLDGSLIARNATAVNEAIEYLSSLPIDIIAENVPKNAAGVTSFLRRHARKYGKINVFSIDYLQMMREPKQGQSRTDELSNMVYELKELAKELKCPCLGLSQLNRGSENRQDERYVMSDLRESGGLEQVADHIWFLSRPGASQPDRSPTHAAIQQRKHRNGSSNNDFQLYWNTTSARYENAPDLTANAFGSGATDSYPDSF